MPGRARGYREGGNKALGKVETKDSVAGVGVAYGDYWNPGNRVSSEKTMRRDGKRRRTKERERVKNYTTCPECQVLGVVYMKQSY